MRNPAAFIVFSSLCSACGGGPPSTPSSGQGSFEPPAAPAGYTRLAAQTVRDVAPGDDVTYCQYVMAPLEHDVDVLDVQGYQSAGGHHIVAQTYVPQAGEMIGSNFPCMGTEFGAGLEGNAGGAQGSVSGGAFLGALGGADGTTTTLPPGVAFRLKKGQGVMLNVHYLNTGENVIDGDAVLDLKLAEADPARELAELFVNVDVGFELPPSMETTSTIDCVAQSEVEIIMLTNHMHEYGTSATTWVQRAGTESFEILHEDPAWTYDMQFDAKYTRWPTDAPFVLRAGDTVRTTCNWNNSTAAPIGFPREMCVAVAFALTAGDRPPVPACFGGVWLPEGV